MVRLFLVLAGLFLVACDNSPVGGDGPEVEHPDFRQGTALQQQGDHRRALECFLKVIDDRKDAAESHLEAGRLYLELREPLSAIYHFKQSQRLKPRPERANSISQLIRTAERNFIQSIPGQPFDPEGGGASVDASQRISQLQAENTRLKRELEDLYRQTRTAPPVARAATSPASTNSGFGGFGLGPAAATTSVTAPSTLPATPNAVPAGARQHTVQSGDTLASLARKYYGSPARWTEIQRANTGVLGGGTALKIGVVLVIPQ